MPVSFTPDNIPRFDSTFLNYVNQNFQRLKQALNSVPKETVSTTAPSSPYVGQTYYNATTQTTFRWNGSAWKEESFMGNRAFSVDSPGLAAMTTGTLTVVPFNTTGLDTALMTYATGTFTVVKAGYYIISTNLAWGLSAAGSTREVFLTHSGVYVVGNASPVNNVVNPRSSVTYPAYLAAGDTITTVGYHDVGANLAVVAGVSATYFRVVRTGG